jgi:ribulose-5-phosphate 4-epimerase/fuculose-1-phosphate aldolase
LARDDRRRPDDIAGCTRRLQNKESTMSVSAETTTAKDEIDPAEWQTRVDLAACYRLISLYGMSDLIYNHITARVPNSEGHVLINSYGYLYEEMTASNLHKIDLDGNVIARPDADYGINETGYVIHGAVHAARPDVGCVIHTHSRASMAVSMMECGLLPLSQHAMRFYGNVAYHDYEGVAVDVDERQRIVADLGDKNVMFMHNHGLLICAESIPEAFNMCYWVEMACKAQVDAMTSGAALILPPEEVRLKTAHQYEPSVRRRYGLLEWESMLRRLDRLSPSYKE